jgi:hypothetical protein
MRVQVPRRRAHLTLVQSHGAGLYSLSLPDDTVLEELVRSSEPVTAPTALVPGRNKTGRPRQQELRSRVVTAVLAGASYRQAAARYGVSAIAAFRWAKRLRHTGSMAAKAMGGDRRSRLKSERDWLLRRVAAGPVSR